MEVETKRNSLALGWTPLIFRPSRAYISSSSMMETLLLFVDPWWGSSVMTTRVSTASQRVDRETTIYIRPPPRSAARGASLQMQTQYSLLRTIQMDIETWCKSKPCMISQIQISLSICSLTSSISLHNSIRSIFQRPVEEKFPTQSLEATCSASCTPC
ncbi:hypothetical protein BGX38DRAFT_380185 [Terfezia claveryi]|nr:hypothetical protein BGX38DRAFT_380185 [Terfezia claveryi]